jgi:transposase
VIAKYLGKHAPTLKCFGLESGATSAWLWREFRALGLPVVCLDSRHAHRVLSMKRDKNDRNDARGLADLVRMGWYREARVRSLDAQLIRSLLLSRQQLQSQRAIENQMRGALKTLGVMTGSTKGRGFIPRVAEFRADNDWLGPILDPLLAAHASIAKQLRAVSASVLDTARRDGDVRRMMTVPGVGPMTALAFKAAIDDPQRFTSSTKVGRRHRQVQRSAATQLSLRGCRRTDDEAAPILPPAAMGLAPCQAHRLEARLHRRGAQARRNPSCHLARRHRVRVEHDRASCGVIEELPRERKASLPGRRAD